MKSMSRSILLGLTALGAASVGGLAQAADWSHKFSAFGTLAVTHSSDDQADFVGSQAQVKGAGFSQDYDFGVDSKLGAQFDVGYGKQWSAVVQVLAERRYNDTYDPDLSLGFLKWKPGYGIDLRVGRLPYSSYLVSDYRKIGYSQTWLRPPLELYYLSGNRVDGGDITWRTSLGSVALKTQLAVGRNHERLAVGEFTSRDLYAFNVTADIGSLTLRGSYLTIQSFSVISPQLDGLYAGIRYGLPANALYLGSPAIPGNPAEADRFSMTDVSTNYSTIGLNYDPGSWFVIAEMGRISAIGFTGLTYEGYLTGGARIKQFTPYATIAKVKTSTLPTSTNPLAAITIAQSNQKDQDSFSLGVRWDFYKNLALKAQVDHVSHAEGSHGTLINLQPGFVPGGSYNVFSASLDFVL